MDEKKILKKIIGIIFKDVSRESESNDLSVLLRVLSLSEIGWLLLMALLMAYQNYAFVCLSCVFSIGVLVAVLMLTYEDRTVVGMYVYIVINHLLVAVGSIETAWKEHFAPMILVCVMLFFFNARVRMKTKVYFSIAEMVFSYSFLFAEMLLPAHSQLDKVTSTILIGLNIANQITAISLEAYAYSLKYTRNEEKIMQYNKKLEDMVSTDALTGLWNRRAMNEHLSLLENGFRKHQKSFHVGIMDIDFFKKVNDTYGHGMGDYVLKSLSALLIKAMEGKGSVARWGGEEFLLTFEGMRFEEAVKTMDEIREMVAEQEFALKDTKLRLTITGGLEDYAMADSVDAVITKADERLYIGKTGGRNRIVSTDEKSGQ